MFLKILYLFLAYSFIGWMLEVVYHVLSQGVIVNRGFLNGPLCPIYGFGMITVLALLEPITHSLPLLFFFGMILTTAIELFGGWLLERTFGLRWWDYSKEHFNLHGYICLKFSLAWGICVAGVVRFVHPLVWRIGDFWLSHKIRYILWGLFAVLMVDLIVTLIGVLHIKKEIKALSKAGKELRHISDALTEVIGKQSMKLGEKTGEARVQMALGKMEAGDYLERRKEENEKRRRALKEEKERKLLELRERKARMHSARTAVVRRMISAFPSSNFHDLKERIEVLIDNYKDE